MRFGQDFHKYTVPEWDGVYFEYDRFKDLIKCSPAANNASIRYSLIEAMTKLKQFESKLYHSMEWRYDEFFYYHSNIQSDSSWSSLDLEERCYAELVVSTLKNDLHKALWFTRVNYEAVDRIISKLHSCTSHLHLDLVLSQWRAVKHDGDIARARITKLMTFATADGRWAPNPSVVSVLFRASQPHSIHSSGHLFMEAIANDSPGRFADYLSILKDDDDDVLPALFRRLFKRLALGHKWRCLLALLSTTTPFFDNHCLEVLFGSIQVPLPDTSLPLTDEILASRRDHVSQIVGKLFATHNHTMVLFLRQADKTGSTPLHDALNNGIDICTTARGILDEDQSDYDYVFGSCIKDKDGLGLTPLHRAVVGGHYSVVTSFFTTISARRMRQRSQQIKTAASSLLATAIKFQCDVLVEKLSKLADYGDGLLKNPSPIHLAAQAGRHDYMKLLIDALAPNSQSLNTLDYRGRTPLMHACARGHASVAEVLLASGANQSVTDHVGWTARNLAMYRGHLGMANLFSRTNISTSEMCADHKMPSFSKPPLTTVIQDLANLVKSKRTLVIYLGSMQLTDNQAPVILDDENSDSLVRHHIPVLRRLELSVNGPNKQCQTVDIPVLVETSSKPYIFTLEDEARPQLLGKLYGNKSVDGVGASVEAVGAIFLNTAKSLCGKERESLIREQTMVLLSVHTHEPIGTVLFTSVIAQSFDHLQKQMPMTSLEAHENGDITLVGHRGFGQNVVDKTRLQLGENTIGSFLTAADHGATFVEDAQVSKDLETVIYHDFSLSETGTDIPIHDVTIDQYKYASSIQTPQGSPLISLEGQTMIGKGRRLRRTQSFDPQGDLGALSIRDRLKHTIDFKAKTTKPNIRGDFIQGPLVTLTELFQRLPSSLGFNIEIKYPRLHEAREAGVAPIALEINVFVDTILEQVHRFAKDRPIILSSFTPEICILLKLKQKAYPILFISNAGKLPANDLERRAASVQAGVHFAKTWGLSGLCLASEPLMLCPDLIGVIKRAGLLCASYGGQNSVPENVQIQRDAGIDLIMVDKVALIAKAIKKSK
ncbi:Glycerophosphoryl diester phosphodiesterase family-domain-containing protein [Xylariaceae sp. FL1272]|nr:Glycerophosphoryl diester phosphodiesterase family-domain-containing protein [Xylariaceae sp. FL1272]